MIILIIAYIIGIIYMATPHLTFKPFSLKFETPAAAIGVIGLSIAIFSFSRAGYNKGYKQAIDDAIVVIQSQSQKHDGK